MAESRLWGGVPFRARPRPDEPLAVGSELLPAGPYDIVSSAAHARELQRAGLLSADEGDTITAELERIRADYAAGAIAPSDADEDLHTFIERILTERLGPLGGKLRAGRSRNDQAANDLRLYLRREARSLALSLLALQEALADQAARHLQTLSPGFTHLQPAQPVLFAHQCLAYAQVLTATRAPYRLAGAATPYRWARGRSPARPSPSTAPSWRAAWASSGTVEHHRRSQRPRPRGRVPCSARSPGWT